MILLLDNYDSFTFNLYQQIGALGRKYNLNVKVTRSDDNYLHSLEREDELEKYKGLVISPGPGTPDRTNYCRKVIELAIPKIPILGVCLGHQLIGTLFNMQVQHAIKPMHGKTSQISHTGKGLFHNLTSPMTVARYHSLVLQEPIEDEITVTARSSQNEIMAIAHNTLPLWGVQFHPESFMSENGDQLIRNFLNRCLMKAEQP